MLRTLSLGDNNSIFFKKKWAWLRSYLSWRLTRFEVCSMMDCQESQQFVRMIVRLGLLERLVGSLSRCKTGPIYNIYEGKVKHELMLDIQSLYCACIVFLVTQAYMAYIMKGHPLSRVCGVSLILYMILEHLCVQTTTTTTTTQPFFPSKLGQARDETRKK